MLFLLAKLIILGFCVNVHCNLTVLMTCQILHRLWINSRIEQVGDIGVMQLMRRYSEVQAVHDVFPDVGGKHALLVLDAVAFSLQLIVT